MQAELATDACLASCLLVGWSRSAEVSFLGMLQARQSCHNSSAPYTHLRSHLILAAIGPGECAAAMIDAIVPLSLIAGTAGKAELAAAMHLVQDPLPCVRVGAICVSACRVVCEDCGG